MDLTFSKMHGLGNDFVIFDFRHPDRAAAGKMLSPPVLAALADRRYGVGCDQIIMMEPPEAGSGDALFMRIYNADGGEVGACGNATRCVGRLLLEETGQESVAIRTRAGRLMAWSAPAGQVRVDMGPARLEWQEIPLATSHNTLRLPVELAPLRDPVAVSMGNPHMVFFVPAVEALPLESLGPVLEVHPLFPQKTNVEIVQVLGPGRLRMRVWERGAGITRACGSGACAVLVAAARRGLCGRQAEVVLDGGVLTVSWEDNQHVLLTGSATPVFTGCLSEAWLEKAADHGSP